MTTKNVERLTRPAVAAMDTLLGEAFPVLDQGFVRVVDYMGDDASVVQAARVSYGKGTKRVSDDRGLIRYLMRKRHTTPFEMAEIKLHVRVPMDAWRQWIRHRTASVNEYSTRYSEAINANQTTEPTAWRSQSKSNKQGSSGLVEDWPSDEDGHIKGGPWATCFEVMNHGTPGDYLTRREEEFQQAARELYEERLAFGVAKEQARKDLPLSTYTEAYWKVDLHNLLHFLALRLDTHAQKEIRDFGVAIRDVVKQWVPLTFEAFQDYRLDAMYLSGPEVKILAKVLNSVSVVPLDEAKIAEVVRDMGGLGKRELKELSAKVERLGAT